MSRNDCYVSNIVEISLRRLLWGLLGQVLKLLSSLKRSKRRTAAREIYLLKRKSVCYDDTQTELHEHTEQAVCSDGK